MKYKITIISKSRAFLNRLNLIFSTDDFDFVFVHIDTVTIETFSAIDTDLVMFNGTNSSVEKIKLLLNTTTFESILFGIVCVIDNRMICEYHYSNESYKVDFILKPIRVEEFRIRVKKILFISKNIFQAVMKQQQLQSEIKQQNSNLAATLQITEHQSHLLDLLLNSVPSGIVAIDESENVVMMNKNAEEIFNVPFSKAIGNSLWRIAEKDVRKNLCDFLYKKAPESNENHCIIKDSNGTENYYDIIIKDFLDNDKAIVGKLIIFRNENSRVEANRIKNSFFTIVSHELRTPLTIISSGVALLKLEKDSVLQDQIISDIAEATERSSELVANILHITYLHEINIHPFYREVQKSDLLNKLFSQFQLKMKRKKIELIQKDTTDNTCIVTDPGLINMVLGSILDNAIKYNKDNGRIFFSIYKENDLFCFEIKDEGKGFEGEASKMFFSSFMQGENNLTRTHSGIGVGLYIAKRASDLIKGNISFTSESEIGSTFILKIPFIPNLNP